MMVEHSEMGALFICTGHNTSSIDRVKQHYYPYKLSTFVTGIFFKQYAALSTVIVVNVCLM